MRQQDFSHGTQAESRPPGSGWRPAPTVSYWIGTLTPSGKHTLKAIRSARAQVRQH
jgi:hypothetical protein